MTGELGTDVVRPWPLPCRDASGRPVMPASDPQCGCVPVPARRALRFVGLAGAVRIGVLAVIALFLAGCSMGVNCGPCGLTAQVGIVGVGHDPARAVLVSVDGVQTCVQLRIGPAPDSSTNPGDLQKYRCTRSDPSAGCFVDGSTAYVDFLRLVPNDLAGRRVAVTATGGQVADENATAVFQIQPRQGVCGCDQSYAQVRLLATS